LFCTIRNLHPLKQPIGELVGAAVVVIGDAVGAVLIVLAEQPTITTLAASMHISVKNHFFT